jgi:hypothetical protein
MEKKKYKLIGLQIEGMRKIRAALLEFKPTGITEIIGKNDQGKSSVIDAIEILLKGFRHAEKGMTTSGMDKTRIIGTVGDWTIKRIISEKTNRLEVVNKEGLSPKKPQDFLDTLINELTFDPQPFLEKNPNDKLKFIMDLMKIDFTQENTKIQAKEEERLQVGRDIKSKGEFKEPEKVDSVDTADLTRQINEIREYNKGEQNKVTTENFLSEKFSAFSNSYETMSSEGNPEYNKYAELMKPVVDEFDKMIKTLPKPEYKSTEDLDNQLASASGTNEKATNYTNYINWKAEKEKLGEKQDSLKKDIEKLRREKLEKLEKIEMPVDGLKITEEGLYFNDIFCENWSKSLGWKIALSLCEKMQPELRAIFLDNGESMDKETRKELDKWAKAHDIQVILTVVDSIPEELDKDAFYIEEGGIFTKKGECIPEPEEEQVAETAPDDIPAQSIPDIQQKEDHSNYKTPDMFNFEFNDEPEAE